MAPYAEDTPIEGQASNGHTVPVNGGEAPMEPGIKKNIAQGKMTEFPRPPKFEDKYKEREYMKGRLAAAFRIFGKFGFDEGVAGHITMRDPVQVSSLVVVMEEEIVGRGNVCVELILNCLARLLLGQPIRCRIQLDQQVRSDPCQPLRASH